MIQGVIFVLAKVLTPSPLSYHLTDSFYDFSTSTSTETDMASKVSYSFGYSWYKGEVAREERENVKKTSKKRYIVSSMRIERYYSSIREDRSFMTDDSLVLLNNKDYVGFFKACGPTYIRGIRRAQEVVTFFIFESQSEDSSKSHAQSIQVSSWWGSGSSNRNKTSKNKSESQSTRIIIQGYGLGLAEDGGESLVAQSLADYHAAMKFAFKTMTTLDGDSINIGMVYGMEVVPWVENTVFQISTGLADEVVELPLAKSLIPRAYKRLDPTNTVFDNSDRESYRCKEQTFEIDMYGYCCEFESLYDYAASEYDGENPATKVCRPMRQLEPVFLKDNMVANGEFVARLDRSVRYKLNQLSTLERCISAVKSIPVRYDWNLLEPQAQVKFDGVVDIDFSVFELKMALDPFDDHAMFEHMAKELDEFLDRFIQPCYNAIFGGNVGTTPETSVSYFMAMPWHSHKECTKLSCLGSSMRWDRSNPDGGCIPSMISGKDSPNFNTGETDCKKQLINGEVRCVHEAAELTDHHENTVNCWKATVPRGRVDFFMEQFCLPSIRAEKLPQKAIDALLKAKATKCSGPVAKSMNVALGKPTKQSNILYHRGGSGYPSNAVDGNTDGAYHRRSVSHTGYDPKKDGTIKPWWYVDLEAEFEIIEIFVYPRTDYIGARNRDFKLTILKEGNVVFTYVHSGIPTEKVTVPNLSNGVRGDKVRIELPETGYRVLQLAEVEVYNRYFD